MVAVHVHRFTTRYRLARPDRQEVLRLQQTAAQALAAGLGEALRLGGIGDEEEVCIRAIHIPMRVRLGGASDGIAAAWRQRVQGAVEGVLRGEASQDLVRYGSRAQAVFDLAMGLAVGDVRRAWAWRSMGLLRGDADVGGMVDALCAEPAAVGPALFEVAARGGLDSLSRRLSAGQWEALCRAALASSGLSMPAGWLAAVAHRGGAVGSLGEAIDDTAVAGAREVAAALGRRSVLWQSLLDTRPGEAVRDRAAPWLALLALLEADPGQLLRGPARAALLAQRLLAGLTDDAPAVAIVPGQPLDGEARRPDGSAAAAARGSGVEVARQVPPRGFSTVEDGARAEGADGARAEGAGSAVARSDAAGADAADSVGADSDDAVVAAWWDWRAAAAKESAGRRPQGAASGDLGAGLRAVGDRSEAGAAHAGGASAAAPGTFADATDPAVINAAPAGALASVVDRREAHDADAHRAAPGLAARAQAQMGQAQSSSVLALDPLPPLSHSAHASAPLLDGERKADLEDQEGQQAHLLARRSASWRGDIAAGGLSSREPSSPHPAEREAAGRPGAHIVALPRGLDLEAHDAAPRATQIQPREQQTSAATTRANLIPDSATAARRRHPAAPLERGRPPTADSPLATETQATGSTLDARSPARVVQRQDMAATVTTEQQSIAATATPGRQQDIAATPGRQPQDIDATPGRQWDIAAPTTPERLPHTRTEQSHSTPGHQSDIPTARHSSLAAADSPGRQHDFASTDSPAHRHDLMAADPPARRHDLAATDNPARPHAPQHDLAAADSPGRQHDFASTFALAPQPHIAATDSPARQPIAAADASAHQRDIAATSAPGRQRDFVATDNPGGQSHIAATSAPGRQRDSAVTSLPAEPSATETLTAACHLSAAEPKPAAAATSAAAATATVRQRTTAREQFSEGPLLVRQQGQTAAGGLLFLSAALARLGILDDLLASPALRTRSLRWSLHRLALTLLPLVDDEPAALAFCGLRPRAVPPSRHEPPPTAAEADALSLLALRLTQVVARQLDPTAIQPPAEVLRWLCLRPALLLADPGWFEVRMSMDRVDLAIRRAGLDANPGFVPHLGVVLVFVYV